MSVAALTLLASTLPIESSSPASESAWTNFLERNWLPRSGWTTVVCGGVLPSRGCDGERGPHPVTDRVATMRQEQAPFAAPR